MADEDRGDEHTASTVRATYPDQPSDPTVKEGDARGIHARQLLERESRFEVRRQLGSGGMGSVFEVLDKERGAVVALKTMHLASPAMLYAFKREFRSLADISHPRLVGLHELIAVEGRWYFTMDLVDGVRFDVWVRSASTLLDGPTVITTRGPHTATMTPIAAETPPDALPPTRANIAALTRALGQLVEGLDALHRAGKVHRDVKPSNVLVTTDGDVRIVDFGLVFDRSGADNTGSSAGTPRYMAPEQGAGHNATPASDFYAVGVMLFAVLTGRSPHRGTMAEILADKQKTPAPRPSSLVSGLPPELDELCVDLLQIAPQLRPTASEILDRLASRERRAPNLGLLPTIFVGRGDVLDSLFATVRSATKKKASRAVLIEGESGIGKSELMRQLAMSLRYDDDTLLLTSRCHQRESVPYNALDGIIDDLADRANERGLYSIDPIDGLDALAKTFPVLGLLLPAHDDTVTLAPGPSDRRRAFAALARLTELVADGRTIVMLIDDMHWADVDSAFALAELLAAAESLPLVVVGAHRALDAGPVVEFLVYDARRPAACLLERISLSRLRAEDAIACAARVMVNRDDALERAQAIYDESRGHPFFVMELARHALESDAEQAPTMADVIDTRLDALSPEARGVMEVVAISGHAISQSCALEAAGLGGRDQDVIASLRNRSFVSARGLRDDDGVEVYHDRIRAAVLGRMPAAARRTLHLALADALERRAEGTSEMIADHCFHAGDLPRAAEHAERAAAHAFDALAFDRAAELYTRAIACRGDQIGITLAERQARSLANAGRGAHAAVAFERCAEQSQGLERLGFLKDAAEQYLVAGHLEQGLATLRPLLDEVGLGYPSSQTRAFISVVGRIAKLSIVGTKVRPRARPLSDEEAFELEVCWAAQRGIKSYDTARGASYMARFLDLALRAGDPRRVGQGLVVLGEAMAFDGSPRSARQAERYIEQATAIADALDDPGLLALTLTSRGMVSMFGCRWREARETTSRGVTMLEQRSAGLGHERAIASMVAILCAEYLGSHRELRERVGAALRDADERGNRYTRVQGLIYDGLCRLAADDPTGTYDRVDEALRMWPADRTLFQHWLAIKTQVSADLYVDDPERALRRLDDAWKRLSRARLFDMAFLRIHALALRSTSRLALAAGGGMTRSLHLWHASRDIRALERDRGERSEPRQYAEAAAANAKAALATIRGAQARAATEQALAAKRFDALDMRSHAAAARRDHAPLRDEGIANPERWMRIYNPSL